VAVPVLFAGGVWAASGGAGPRANEAAPVGLTARLGAAQEVPRPKGAPAAAGGSFAAELVRGASRTTLSWRLTFRGLSGKATAAHVHRAAPGRAGPVAVPLCGPCRSGAEGSAKVDGATLRALVGGNAYVNVHTARNPAGEVRGQLRRAAKTPPSPQPTTTAGTGTTVPTTTTTVPYDPGY
jgi:hypothetical protein